MLHARCSSLKLCATLALAVTRACQLGKAPQEGRRLSAAPSVASGKKSASSRLTRKEIHGHEASMPVVRRGRLLIIALAISRKERSHTTGPARRTASVACISAQDLRRFRGEHAPSAYRQIRNRLTSAIAERALTGPIVTSFPQGSSASPVPAAPEAHLFRSLPQYSGFKVAKGVGAPGTCIRDAGPDP